MTHATAVDVGTMGSPIRTSAITLNVDRPSPTYIQGSVYNPTFYHPTSGRACDSLEQLPIETVADFQVRTVATRSHRRFLRDGKGLLRSKNSVKNIALITTPASQTEACSYLAPTGHLRIALT